MTSKWACEGLPSPLSESWRYSVRLRQLHRPRLRCRARTSRSPSMSESPPEAMSGRVDAGRADSRPQLFMYGPKKL